MSSRTGRSRDPRAADHQRARELAARAVDEPLAGADAAWLVWHLGRCAPCRGVAAEYDEQRVLLRRLRDAAPPPPRDLWARTAASIEAVGARRAPWYGIRGRRRVPLAPLAGLLVLAVAVGAGLLNGGPLFPGQGPAGGAASGPAPTPIAMTAGVFQFVTRGEDGALELSTSRYDAVCPVGSQDCGTSAASDTTPLSAGLSKLGSFDAVISPSQDRIVVMGTNPSSGGVFVVPVNVAPAASPTPASTGEPSLDATPPQASASASVAPSQPATETPTAPVTPPATPTVTPPATPTATPPATPTATPTRGTPSPGAGASATPSQSPDATPSPADTAGASTAPSPTATVEVTPAPDGALEIASGVVVVGSASAYSPDGTQFAFTARPADDSAGPDVYVWQTSEALAHQVTLDHGSLLAGWLGDQLLVSRLVDGIPTTWIVDPATGSEEAVPAERMWRPTVGPHQRTGVWWDGTVTSAEDGFSWTPAEGQLVLGGWPDGAGSQVLETGVIRDWQVRWDESGTALALWVTDGESGDAGRLSLYQVDPVTGAVNLDKPILADAPAFAGFSLRHGRLAWTAPAPDASGADPEDTTVEVLAWSGESVGHLAVHGRRGAIVVR